MRRLSPALVFLITSMLPLAARAADAGADANPGPFTYDPPGTLVPATSGKGRVDSKVYEPTMLFPMEKPYAFANSQVYGHGGGEGPGGSQCDKENFSYPWHDNYCESRSWDMPLCPSGTGHQGQDIRGASCVKNVHNVLAAEDGTITNVGSYSVYLTTKLGTRFDYLHMGSVAVKVGDVIKRGAMLGKVSNEFGGSATTVHLHFNIRQNVTSLGNVYVPPYTSLVESYKRFLDPKYGTTDPDAGVSAPDAGSVVVTPPPDSGKPPTAPKPSNSATPDGSEDGCATKAPGGPMDATAPLASLALGLALTGLLRRRSKKS